MLGAPWSEVLLSYESLVCTIALTTAWADAPNGSVPDMSNPACQTLRGPRSLSAKQWRFDVLLSKVKFVPDSFYALPLKISSWRKENHQNNNQNPPTCCVDQLLEEQHFPCTLSLGFDPWNPPAVGLCLRSSFEGQEISKKIGDWQLLLLHTYFGRKMLECAGRSSERSRIMRIAFFFTGLGWS